MASNEWSGIRKLFLMIIFQNKNKRGEKYGRGGGRGEGDDSGNWNGKIIDKSVADVE